MDAWDALVEVVIECDDEIAATRAREHEMSGRLVGPGPGYYEGRIAAYKSMAKWACEELVKLVEATPFGEQPEEAGETDGQT